jgi:hypothetical protein
VWAGVWVGEWVCVGVWVGGWVGGCTGVEYVRGLVIRLVESQSFGEMLAGSFRYTCT